MPPDVERVAAVGLGEEVVEHEVRVVARFLVDEVGAVEAAAVARRWVVGALDAAEHGRLAEKGRAAFAGVRRERDRHGQEQGEEKEQGADRLHGFCKFDL